MRSVGMYGGNGLNGSEYNSGYDDNSISDWCIVWNLYGDMGGI